MLVGMNVTIRPVRDSDLDTFFEDQADPEAAAMAAVASRDKDAYFAHWDKNRQVPTNVMRTVLVDGEVAGNVVSWLQGDFRLVGYWISHAFWGRGVATAALGLFLGEVTDRPLTAHVAETNVGSVRVLEKCGFIQVGREIGDDAITELIMRLDG